ncbi:uncharacterized protein [Miscanthus floridulus]|uniref:uncharacterized protein n=1 Tax=Miscanthus floridulus TaxID=154761 RepID=UPI00345A025C
MAGGLSITLSVIPSLPSVHLPHHSPETSVPLTNHIGLRKKKTLQTSVPLTSHIGHRNLGEPAAAAAGRDRSHVRLPLPRAISSVPVPPHALLSIATSLFPLFRVGYPEASIAHDEPYPLRGTEPAPSSRPLIPIASSASSTGAAPGEATQNGLRGEGDALLRPFAHRPSPAPKPVRSPLTGPKVRRRPLRQRGSRQYGAIVRQLLTDLEEVKECSTSSSIRSANASIIQMLLGSSLCQLP